MNIISTHGDLENTILNAVWSIEENGQDADSIDVGYVQKTINSEQQKWAYTTIKTVLDRLVEKALLNKIKFGRKYFYSSTCSRLEIAERAIRKISQQYFRSDMVSMLRMIEKLSESQLTMV